MKILITIGFLLVAFISWSQTNQELLTMPPTEFFAHPSAQETIDIENPNHHLLTIATFQATNLLRQKLNMSTFQPDKNLYGASRIHINEMVNYRFFNHINPYNKQYETPFDRVQNRGGTFQVVAENIAIVPLFKSKKEGRYMYRKVHGKYQYFNLNGQPLQFMTYGEFGKSLVTDWYRSVGHRKNLMNSELTHLGLAVKIVRNKTNGGDLPEAYAVQNFGATF